MMLEQARLEVVHEPLADRTPEAPYFEANYRVRAGDIDQEMRLRLDGVARYLQDVANDNLEATDFANTDPFWVVRRTVIDVIEPISWPATVTLQRWCSGLSTRWANMRVRMTATHETSRLNPVQRPDGLVETEAFWINVNENGMPTRISDGGFAWLSSMNDNHRLRMPMSPRAVPDHDPGMPADRSHILRTADFDPFKHVNNAAYWVVVEDELVEHPDILDAPHRAVIDYLRPIAPGSDVIVRRRRDGEQLQIWMIVDDRIVTTMTVDKLSPEHSRGR
ncbi:acyl-ACP thioesterase domain-containing protein [Nocardia altamirensis]|uniref:acyl-[acyl-carrier-protein] thioesterase n=1 Tax=Nocardia altamirensis TaxID=472158 RepID=UPI0009FE5386